MCWCAWKKAREYRTYFHIGSSWGVSEATVYRIVRWVEDYLMRCGQFRLAGKKQLVRGFGKPQVVVMDVTETPIEYARFGGEASPPNSARPKRRQRQFYSGKKKQHTLKCQIVLFVEQWANHLHVLWQRATARLQALSSFWSAVCP